MSSIDHGNQLQRRELHTGQAHTIQNGRGGKKQPANGHQTSPLEYCDGSLYCNHLFVT